MDAIAFTQTIEFFFQIHFHHTHKINNAEAYSYLRVAKHIQDEFIEMFSNGMTPSAAKAYHEIKLTANIDDDMQTIKLLADAQTNPTDRQVYQMFDYWR